MKRDEDGCYTLSARRAVYRRARKKTLMVRLASRLLGEDGKWVEEFRLYSPIGYCPDGGAITYRPVAGPASLEEIDSCIREHADMMEQLRAWAHAEGR